MLFEHRPGPGAVRGIKFAQGNRHVIYDFNTRQFVDERTGERRSIEARNELSRRLAATSPARYLGGSSTQARAALINTLVRRAGKEDWREVMAALGDQLHGRGLDFELERTLLPKRGGPRILGA